jgi:hypothetical protein
MYNAAVGRGYTDVAAWLEANEGSDATVWDEEAATLQAKEVSCPHINAKKKVCNKAWNPTAGTRGGTRAKDGQHATPIDARWIESSGSSHSPLLQDGHLHAFHSFITLPTNLKGRNHLNFVRVRTIATPVPAPQHCRCGCHYTA